MSKQLYDLTQYSETDHNIVTQISMLTENETLDLEITRMDGTPVLEENGDPVIVSLPQNELNIILEYSLQYELDFTSAFWQIVTKGLELSDLK